MQLPRDIMLFGLCIVFVMDGPPIAQVAQEAQSLNKLVEFAVEVEGAAYGNVREAIMPRGAAAVPLLERMRASEVRHRRIVAESMLSWIREPETNRRRQELLRLSLVNAIGVITGPVDGIIAAEVAPDEDDALPDMERALVTFAPRLGQDELHEHSAAPFLLELIIKGAISPPSPEEIERAGEVVGKLRKKRLMALGSNPNYGLWARCYAAVLVGRLRHQDVVPVLAELVRSDKHPELRACAAAGLYNTRSGEGVEALVEAMSDSHGTVREWAYYALREITGQDFGQREEKYRNWWQQKKAEGIDSTRERPK